MSADELYFINGGSINWKDYTQAMVNGAISGAAGGAAGAGGGAVAGALLGAAGAGIDYLLDNW